MTLSKWQPFQELSSMRKQLDRLFDEMLSVGDSDWMGRHGLGGRWTPAVELKETETELVLKAEIPGIEAQELEVEVGEERVTISGEHQEEKRSEDPQPNYFHSELHYGKFERVVPLPMPIKTEEIKSEFKQGILRLTLPKREAVPQKAVKVKLEDS